MVVNILPLPSALHICPKQDALVIGYDAVYGSDGIPPITSIRIFYAHYIYRYSGFKIFISLKVMRELTRSFLMYPKNVDWSAKTNSKALKAKMTLKNPSLTLYYNDDHILDHDTCETGTRRPHIRTLHFCWSQGYSDGTLSSTTSQQTVLLLWAITHILHARTWGNYEKYMRHRLANEVCFGLIN